MLIETAIG